MGAAGIERAHVVGLSMGGFVALHFGLRYADRAESVTVAGVGHGAKADQRDQFAADSEALAAGYEGLGSEAIAAQYADGRVDSHR